MPKTGEGQAQAEALQVKALAELRARIDRIDETMHRLLLDRSEVIDALIRTKGTSLPGAAFRPGREADMMRRIVARHQGALPLATVEHIWREIITTFTWMQAPFALAIDGGAPQDAMRDLARFYFGFTVTITTAKDAQGVIERIAASGADLGLVALDQPAGAGLWWRGLGGDGRPRIMSLLPYIRAAQRPADLPAFVVSPPLSDPAPGELNVYAATGKAKASPHVAILAEAEEDGRRETLIAVSNKLGAAEAARAAGVPDIRLIGTLSEGIALDGREDLLFRAPKTTKQPA
jgi:chorismate mutase